jgi:hypothetical protein
LHYTVHRYYSPLNGRFLTVDPLTSWFDAINVGNGYTAVGNRFRNDSDPLGLHGGSTMSPGPPPQLRRSPEEARLQGAIEAVQTALAAANSPGDDIYDDPNIRVVLVDDLPDDVTAETDTTYPEDREGLAGVWGWIWGGAPDIEIRFNRRLLPFRTAEGLVRTIVHEGMHAYNRKHDRRSCFGHPRQFYDELDTVLGRVMRSATVMRWMREDRAAHPFMNAIGDLANLVNGWDFY